VPCLTTLSAGVSAARAIARARIDGEPDVLCLQDLHGAAHGDGGRARISDRGKPTEPSADRAPVA
jgi:hypothetical protein